MALNNLIMRNRLAAAMALTAAVSCAGIGVAAAAAATAAATSADTKSASENTGALEEVIVTARRRSEDQQRVPIAITNLSAQDLELRGITTTEGLNHAIINFAPAPSSFFGLEQASFRMRGLPNVGVYVDGVAHQESFGMLGDVVEMERIEVLRGPQGTLYGKNSLAGAVQYITKAPSDSFNAKFSATVGDYRRFNVSGTADIPLSPTLLTKLTAAKVTRDGYMPSTSVNQEFGSEDNTLGRADVLWKPTDKFKWRFSFEQDRIGTNGNATTLWGLSFSCAPLADAGNNPGAACPYVAASTHGAPQLAISQKSLYGISEQYQTASNYLGPEMFTDLQNYTTILDYQLSDQWSIKGIGSYRDVKSEHFEDFASIGVNMFEGENNNSVFETTGEVQLQFNGDTFSGTTGVYYYNDYHRYRRNNWFANDIKASVSPSNNAAANAGLDAVFGLPPGTLNIPQFGPPDPDQLVYYKIHGIAGYTQWTWKATDQFQVTAGVRYNRDSNSTTAYNPANPIPNICCVPSASYATAGLSGAPVDLTFTNTSPMVSFQYQWTPSIMTFFTYSEGFNQGGGTETFKSVTTGGVTTQVVQIQAFDPEKLKNFEVGVKSDLLDHTLRLNASVYYSKYSNVQVTEDINFNSVTTNAGAGRAYGLEFEGEWVPSTAFKINWGLAYLDTKFTDVPILPANEIDNQIAPGSPFPYAPKESAVVGAQYDTPLASGAAVTLRVDEGWTSWVNSSVASSNVYIPSYGLLGARAIYHSQDGKWDAQVYGTNLLNKFYRLNGYNIAPLGNLNTGEAGLPRMWGVTFNFKFQ